jgi:hypothetical protein
VLGHVALGANDGGNGPGAPFSVRCVSCRERLVGGVQQRAQGFGGGHVPTSTSNSIVQDA